eukprot:gene2421-4700_t
MKNQYEDIFSFVKDLVAGGLSGIIAKTATAPVERVKLILQTQYGNYNIPLEMRYKGPINCLIRVTKEQGIVSLWRGNFASVLRYFPNQAINFASKDKYKNFFLSNVSKKDFWRFCLGNLAAGGCAGATALLCTHPLDVVRTRLATDLGKTTSTRQFRGAAVFKSLHLGGYDILKSVIAINTETNILIKFAVAQALTLVVGTLCYPFDTIKRRVMMQ